jgi:hypothetical protein
VFAVLDQSIKAANADREWATALASSYWVTVIHAMLPGDFQFTVSLGEISNALNQVIARPALGSVRF